MNLNLVALIVSSAIFLTGCGTLTGIPSHGGGKRFAVEQELISASARSAAKDLDLKPLVGKKCAVLVTVIGDEGSGVMTGGRYSLDALIRGEYINSPTTTTQNSYSAFPSTAYTESGGLSSTTNAVTVINAPTRSKTSTEGGAFNSYGGVRVGGQGDYANETLITNPRDVTFLTNLIQTVFFLRGIDVVPPNVADTDVFITVDVFGTIRNRTDYAISNQERLIAATKLEMFAVDRKTKSVVVPPKVSSFEAEYEEQFALWVGPFKKSKNIERAESLLVDFSDVKQYPNTRVGSEPQFEQGQNKQTRLDIKDPIIIRETRERREH